MSSIQFPIHFPSNLSRSNQAIKLSTLVENRLERVMHGKVAPGGGDGRRGGAAAGTRGTSEPTRVAIIGKNEGEKITRVESGNPLILFSAELIPNSHCILNFSLPGTRHSATNQGNGGFVVELWL